MHRHLLPNVFTILLLISHSALAVEVGENDFRISRMGPDNNTNYAGRYPSAAFNRTANEFLVVWEGDDKVDNEREIFGQRIDAVTGAAAGSAVQISRMGPDNDTNYAAVAPDVAYNPTNNEYFVVWQGDDKDMTKGLVDNEMEIFGQRVNGTTGQPIGEEVRLSDMGSANGDTAFGGYSPAVAYNSANNEYLVVWEGDDDMRGLVDNEKEIFGQRVSGANGMPTGANDFRISEMGTMTGNAGFDAYVPDVAYNSANNEYLVVWEGDDDRNGLVDNESEIFGQRIAGATGAPIDEDFQISDMGGENGDRDFEAVFPAIVHNPTNNEYLVVWNGTDNEGELVEGEMEIFGQRVSGANGSLAGNNLRISEMGSPANDDFQAYDAAVTYNKANNEYLVVWDSDDDTGALVDNEYEIYGRRIDAATGAPVEGDFRISQAGEDGNGSFDAFRPTLDYDPIRNRYLVVWDGDNNLKGTVDGETEIFGQLLSDPKCGNGTMENAETCDDGNAVDTDACTNACKPASCGDGIVQSGVEACDDANKNNDDSCLNSCALPGCGDGLIQSGELCEDGNAINTDNCLATCVPASCGDGFIRAGVETCDDKNSKPGDGCSSTCQVEKVTTSTEKTVPDADDADTETSGGGSFFPFDSSGCSLVTGRDPASSR